MIIFYNAGIRPLLQYCLICFVLSQVPLTRTAGFQPPLVFSLDQPAHHHLLGFNPLDTSGPRRLDSSAQVTRLEQLVGARKALAEGPLTTSAMDSSIEIVSEVSDDVSVAVIEPTETTKGQLLVEDIDGREETDTSVEEEEKEKEGEEKSDEKNEDGDNENDESDNENDEEGTEEIDEENYEENYEENDEEGEDKVSESRLESQVVKDDPLQPAAAPPVTTDDIQSTREYTPEQASSSPHLQPQPAAKEVITETEPPTASADSPLNDVTSEDSHAVVAGTETAAEISSPSSSVDGSQADKEEEKEEDSAKSIAFGQDVIP